MSSAGAQSNHINHVTTQMQYAAVVAVGSLLAISLQDWYSTPGGVALGI